MEVIEERKEAFVPVSLRMVSAYELDRVKAALELYIKRCDIIEQDTLHKAYSELLRISLRQER